MKKSCTLILAGLAVLAGCSTAPKPPEGNGVGVNAVTIAYGKVLNIKEYSQIYNEKPAQKVHETKTNKAHLGKNYSLGRPVYDDELYDEFISTPEPILSMDMVELHIQNEQGPNFKIDQVKNASYHMGQRVRITMTGNVAKVTPY